MNRWVFWIGATCFLLASCKFQASCGGTKLKKGDMETTVRERAAKVAPVKTVACPGDLEAKAGAETVCTVTFEDGSQHPHVVRITDVDKESSKVHYVYGFQPPVISPALIEQTLDAPVKQRNPEARLECGDQVMPIPDDNRFACQIHAGGERFDVRVQLTLDDDGNASFEIVN